MHLVSEALSGRHVAPRQGKRTLAPPKLLRGNTLSTITRATYDVDAEPVAPRAPNAAPRFGGSPPPPTPPPPPPPPPPQASRGLQSPTRREMLFGALGLGLGVAGTYAYDNWPLEQADVDEKLAAIIDEILDDEAILNVMGEEILLKRQMKQQEDTVSSLEALQAVDRNIDRLLEEVEAKLKGAEQGSSQ